jgi:hypothetical protein
MSLTLKLNNLEGVLMKSLALASVLALSTAAFGAADSSLNDLQYVPNAGTIYGSSQLTHFKYDTGESNAFNQRVGYSFTDNLFTEVALSYSFTGNDSGFDALGDIVFNGRYRLMESNGNRFDLVGGVSISPEDSEMDGDEGNNFSGGHSVKVGAEFGNKSNERQWSFGAFYTQNLEATTDYGDGDEETADAHGNLSFAANLLTRLADKCFFKTVAAVNFEQKYDIDADFGNYEQAGTTIWNLGGEFQHFLSNDLYLNLGAQAYLFGRSSVGPAMLYNVGANYQF